MTQITIPFNLFIYILQLEEPEMRNVVWNCWYLYGMWVLPEWQKGHSNQKNVSSSVPEIHSQLVAQTFSSMQTATIYLTTCYLPKSTSTWNYSWQISYRPTGTQNINKATVNAARLQTVPFCTVNWLDPRKRNWEQVPSKSWRKHCQLSHQKKAIAAFHSDVSISMKKGWANGSTERIIQTL